LREVGWSGRRQKERIHEGSRKQRIAEFLNGGVVVPWTAASFREKKAAQRYMPQTKTQNQTHNPTTNNTTITNTTNFWTMRLNSNVTRELGKCNFSLLPTKTAYKTNEKVYTLPAYMFIIYIIYK
jgi:hypothetical protein